MHFQRRKKVAVFIGASKHILKGFCEIGAHMERFMEELIVEGVLWSRSTWVGCHHSQPSQ